MTTSSNIDFSVWLGDEPTVRFPITDAQGLLDLTGATVTFRWIDRDQQGSTSTRAMTIVETGPSPAPVVTVTFQSGDLDTEDVYVYEIRIVDGGGNQLTIPSPPEKSYFRVVAGGVP